MADDRHYVGGDWYRICERTGFKVRQGRTRQEWTGRFVRDQSWEERNAQDFVRGSFDDQMVSDPRPRMVDGYVGPLITQLLADAPAGATVLNVVTSVRMIAGDDLWIVLGNNTTGGEADTGYARIVSIVSTTSIQITPGLRNLAQKGAVITDITSLAPTFTLDSSLLDGSDVLG